MPSPDDIADLLSSPDDEVRLLRLQASIDEASQLQDTFKDYSAQSWVAAVQRERDEWRRALQSLTPMGSEFQTPEDCRVWIEDRRRRSRQREFDKQRQRDEAVQRAERAEGLVTALLYLWTRDSQLPVDVITEEYVYQHLGSFAIDAVFSDQDRADMARRLVERLGYNRP